MEELIKKYGSPKEIIDKIESMLDKAITPELYNDIYKSKILDDYEASVALHIANYKYGCGELTDEELLNNNMEYLPAIMSKVEQIKAMIPSENFEMDSKGYIIFKDMSK